jgi:hypothetical protein
MGIEGFHEEANYKINKQFELRGRHFINCSKQSKKETK